MNLRLCFVPLAALVTFSPTLQAVDISKDNNTDALNLATSWVGGVLPGSADIISYDSTITTFPLLSQIGASLAVDGIRVGAVGGTRNAGGAAATPQAVAITGSGTATILTIGPSGIDMSNATQGLAVWPPVNLAGDQNWIIANANTNASSSGLSQNEDLTFIAQGAAHPFNLGGFTVTKTGAGTAAFSSGWTLSNGNFQVNGGVLHIQGGSNRVTNVASTVDFTVNTGGTLRFASQSGASGISTVINGPVRLAEGSNYALLLNQANALNLTGLLEVQGTSTWTVTGGAASIGTLSGPIQGSGNLTYANNSTVAGAYVNLTGDNSTYNGHLTLNGASGTRTLRLSNTSSGSAAATWTVAPANTLQVHGVNVTLGTLNGAGTVSNSGTVPCLVTVGAGHFSGTFADSATPGGSIGLVKTGPGSFRLTGPEAFTGIVDVQGGSLATSTSQTGAGAVTVASGAQFGVETKTTPGIMQAASLTTSGGTGNAVFVETGGLGNPLLPVMALSGNFAPAAGTVLEVRGTAVNSGSFNFIKYNGALTGAGFGALSLKLPFRVTGSLVNNTANSSIDVNITGVDYPKWNGNLGTSWDFDNGTGTGTSNWRTTSGGIPAKYLQSPSQTDQVRFDDTASGSGIVDLTTVLSPVGIRVENSTKTYTFSGSGNLTGSGAITKAGTGDFLISNTAVNDHTGPTTILAGRLLVGDNLTPGGGTLGTGPVAVSGSLLFNRPDDFDVPNSITGTGTLVQQGDGITSLTSPLVGATPVSITKGALRLAGGGTTLTSIQSNGRLILDSAVTLSGSLSGNGIIESAGAAAKSITSPVSNAFSGLLKVSGGTLNLNVPSGQNAVGGDVLVEGGLLSWTQPDQLAPTASITITGGSMTTVNRADTIKNLTISSASAVTTFSALTITDTLLITAGVHDAVNSNGTLTTNKVILNGSSNTRFGTNSGDSTWNVGAGGLTMDSATIQFGNAGAAFFARLKLGADFKGTGTNVLTRPNTQGPREVDLMAVNNRVFDIADGITTIGVDLVNGGIHKSGQGTLSLDSLTNSYTGPTTITQGVLALGSNGEIPTSPTLDLAGGSFDVLAKTSYLVPAAQTITGSGAIAGNIDLSGTLSPGTVTVPGTLDITGNLRLEAASRVAIRIKATGTPAAGRLALQGPGAGDLAIDPAAVLTVTALDGTTLPTGTILPIITYTGIWDGGTFAGLPAGGTLVAGGNSFLIKYNDMVSGVNAVTLTSAAATSPYNTWAAAAGLTGNDALPTEDPDGDGAVNQLEFAVSSLPAPGSGPASTPASRTTVAIATVSGTPRLTMTIPVRNGAVFSGTTEMTAVVDGVPYRIQGSDGLGTWTLTVSEVNPALTSGLPVLPTGWTYRTFCTPGPVISTAREFIRLKTD